MGERVRRFGQRIHVRPDRIEEYELLHAEPWAGVLDPIRRSNSVSDSLRKLTSSITFDQV